MELSDEITMHITALNFQGNQYKMMFEKGLGKFCEALYVDSMKEAYEDVHTYFSTNVPWKTCPYPKGPNEIHDYATSDLSYLTPPYVPGGEKWQFQVRFLKDDQIFGGYNVYGLLRNEQSLLNGG